MTRALPPTIAALLRPIPADFAVAFEDRGRLVRWSATLIVEGYGPIEVELGYSRAAGKVDEHKEQSNLRARIWQTLELARLGRGDLLDYCTVGRHDRRRVLKAMATQ